jgi:hypothetical protein
MPKIWRTILPDSRQLMRTALAANDDAAMIKVLQIARPRPSRLCSVPSSALSKMGGSKLTRAA